VKHVIRRGPLLLAGTVLTALSMVLALSGAASAVPAPRPPTPHTSQSKPTTSYSMPTTSPTTSPTQSSHDDGHNDRDRNDGNRDRDNGRNQHKPKPKPKPEPKPQPGHGHRPPGKYPPPPPPQCRISNPHPRPGSHVTLGGYGFHRGERVHIRIHSVVQVLGVTTADAAGDALANIAIPADFTGQHELTMTGDTSGYTNSIAIVLAAPTSATSNHAATATKASGRTSYVGPVTAGVGALAVALLMGSGVLLAVGRRRKARAQIPA
jgi:hypothetical protein